jgi:hypothetical protein
MFVIHTEQRPRCFRSLPVVRSLGHTFFLHTDRLKVMLFYDIAITFGDEIERVWMRKYTPMTVLWFLVNFILFSPSTNA